MANSHPEATFCGQSLKIQRDYPHAVLPESRQVSAWLTETVKQLRSWERSDDAGRNGFPLGQWSDIQWLRKGPFFFFPGIRASVDRVIGWVGRS
jgi:hypothetical protein